MGDNEFLYIKKDMQYVRMKPCSLMTFGVDQSQI